MAEKNAARKAARGIKRRQQKPYVVNPGLLDGRRAFSIKTLSGVSPGLTTVSIPSIELVDLRPHAHPDHSTIVLRLQSGLTLRGSAKSSKARAAADLIAKSLAAGHLVGSEDVINAVSWDLPKIMEV